MCMSLEDPGSELVDWGYLEGSLSVKSSLNILFNNIALLPIEEP